MKISTESSRSRRPWGIPAHVTWTFRAFYISRLRSHRENKMLANKNHWILYARAAPRAASTLQRYSFSLRQAITLADAGHVTSISFRHAFTWRNHGTCGRPFSIMQTQLPESSKIVFEPVFIVGKISFRSFSPFRHYLELDRHRKWHHTIYSVMRAWSPDKSL